MQAIDYALGGLEAEALQTGNTLGVAQGYPVSLERLRLWATPLEDKGSGPGAGQRFGDREIGAGGRRLRS